MQVNPIIDRRWFAVKAGLASLSILCMAVFWFSLSEKLKDTQHAWETTHQTELDAAASLNRLRGIIGYGGFIHNFKNYILRRDQRYLDRALETRQAYLAESEYLRELLVDDEERHALSIIDATFQEYFDKFDLAATLPRSVAIEELDQVVRVDDGPALKAFAMLQTSIERRNEKAAEIASEVFSGSSVLVYLGGAVGILIVISSGLGIWFLNQALRSNKALSQLLRQNVVLFDLSPDAMLYVSDDGRVKKANRQAEILFGYSRDEFTGMSVDSLVPERLRAGHAALRAGYLKAPKVRPMGRTLELRGVRKSGDEVPVDISLSYIEDRELGGTVVLIVRDVTLQRRMQDDLHSAKSSAEAANRAKSEFLANMSHEIRTPLTGVLGMADLLETSALTDQQKVYVDTLRKSGGHLSSILNDILDLSKLDAGKLVLNKEPMDITALFTSVESVFSHQATSKGVDLVFSFPDGLDDMTFLGDQVRVRQILFNLVGNAIKFTDKGTVSVSASVRTPETPDCPAGLELVVQDSGIGMDKEFMVSLFNPFEQAQTRRDRNYEGTGLGLSICKRLVDAMEGTISAKSDVGHGTTFTIALPLELVEREKVTPPPVKEPMVAPKETKGASVLIADDNPVNRMLLEQMLAGFGHDVTLAEDGLEAYNAFLQGSFDAVLLDIHMPKMDGVETLTRMREHGIADGTVLIAITADVVPENVARFLEAGFQKCIAKPIDWKALNAAILRSDD